MLPNEDEDEDLIHYFSHDDYLQHMSALTNFACWYPWGANCNSQAPATDQHFALVHHGS